MLVRSGGATKRAHVLWREGERGAMLATLVVGGFAVDPPGEALTLLDASEDQREELASAGYRLAQA